jgi:hypothetical protein
MTGLQLALRMVGVAFASVVMLVLLAALNGGARTAEAAEQTMGLSDLLGDGGDVGSLLDPVIVPIDNVVAPIVDPVAQPLAPVVQPVVAPVADPIVDVVAPIVHTVVPPVTGPTADVVEPVVEPVAGPIVVVDPIVEPVVDVVEPVVDVVAPTPTPTVDPPATGPIGPQPAPTTPGAPAPPLGSPPAITPNTPLIPLTPDLPITPLDPAGDDAAAAAAVVDGADVIAVETIGVPTSAATTSAAATPAATSEAIGGVSAFPPLDPRVRMPLGTAPSPEERSAPTVRFPGDSSGKAALPSIVSGLLSAASSSAPSPGAPTTLLAVLTATVAAMFMLSRRVTAEVAWRSVLVVSSVERPG